MSRYLALAAVLLLGCPPNAPPAPVPPDATDAAPAPPGDDCAAACARLAALGCTQGSASTCVPVLRHAQDAGIARLVDGGALRCADIAAAHGTVDLAAMGIHCP